MRTVRAVSNGPTVTRSEPWTRRPPRWRPPGSTPGFAAAGPRPRPDARIVALSEHHATVEMPPDVALPRLGDPLRIVPNHACAVVNLADELIVVADGRQVDRWVVAARGANT
ncbi:hypothetical protein Ait01nite_037630 [Actinoplanes italicus]|nr:hypothetical protein [Actinoplanes italicus]GIE30718.1 hypothetical protein Ait01nite_037630 [Actinoplanes italicus]